MKADFFLWNKMFHPLLGWVFFATLLLTTSASAAGGKLDPTFGTNGTAVTDLGSSSDSGVNVVLQPDGKIVIAASGSTPSLLRYNPDGTLDTAFGTNGKVTAAVGGPVALQKDGKLIVGGAMTGGIGLARYGSSGTLDTTFGTNGVVSVWENDNNSNFRYTFGDLAIQPDGKIVVITFQEAIGGNHVNCVIARFLGNGVLEEDSRAFFDESNFPESERNFCKAIALQADGRILLSGHAEPNFSGMAIILGRFKSGSTTSFDPAFGTNGHGTVVTHIASFVHGRGALAIQADGKIVLAGTTTDNLNQNLALARYNSNGTLDSALGGSGIVITDLGANEVGNDLAVQSDGRILVAGKSESGTSSDLLLVRYNSNGSQDTSFGDGGKVLTDLGGSESILGMALQSDGKILVTGSKDGDAVLARYSISTTPPLTRTTAFRSKRSQDGWILESTEASNVGGSLNRSSTTFNLGDDPKDRQYRSIISFNTASLPDNARITSAYVSIKKQGLVGTDPFTTHGFLLLEIRNGLFNNDLDLRLSDFAAPPSSSAPDAFGATTFSWYTAPLSSSNLAFINKTGVTQFRLRFSRDDNDDGNADYIKFFSGEAPGGSQPKLVVSYMLP
jgi:uncharacterized delta-60 repeat protein